MTILLIGAGGQVGRRLAPLLASLGPVRAATRREADLEQVDQVRRFVRDVAPRLLVNAAGYTAVDAAESDAPRCRLINAYAAGALAEESARLGAPIIHFSTNYVFDGASEQPYRETDSLAPLNVYGETKALGDRLVAEANPAHLIFRTTGIYDRVGTNFFLRILELAREREELRVVNDQFGAPTPAHLLADAVARVASLLGKSDWADDGFGVYHITTQGSASWHEFAVRTLALDPHRDEQRCRIVHAISSGEYPTPAARPRNGVLDTSNFSRRFGFALPTWEEALRQTIDLRDGER